MRLKHPAYGAVLFLSACSTPPLWPAGTASSRLTASNFLISAGRSYSLSGNFRFETALTDLQRVDSPNVSGSAPDGSLIFNAPRSGSPGGTLQVTFRDVKATFDFACYVGGPLEFDVSVAESGPGGGTVTRKVRATGAGGPNILHFSTPPMYGKSDLVVRIWNSSALQAWNLARCEVSATPQA